MDSISNDMIRYYFDFDVNYIPEIVGMRSENAKLFQLADGTIRAVVFPYPIHQLDENGEWQDISGLYVEQAALELFERGEMDPAQSMRESSNVSVNLPELLPFLPYEITILYATLYISDGDSAMSANGGRGDGVAIDITEHIRALNDADLRVETSEGLHNRDTAASTAVGASMVIAMNLSVNPGVYRLQNRAANTRRMTTRAGGFVQGTVIEERNLDTTAANLRNQLFRFDFVRSSGGLNLFVIRPMTNITMVVTASGNSALLSYLPNNVNVNTSQFWIFEASGGFHRIRRYDGQALALSTANGSNGAALSVRQFAATNNEQWTLVPHTTAIGGGFFTNINTPLPVDVERTVQGALWTSNPGVVGVPQWGFWNTNAMVVSENHQQASAVIRGERAGEVDIGLIMSGTSIGRFTNMMVVPAPPQHHWFNQLDSQRAGQTPWLTPAQRTNLINTSFDRTPAGTLNRFYTVGSGRSSRGVVNAVGCWITAYAMLLRNRDARIHPDYHRVFFCVRTRTNICTSTLLADPYTVTMTNMAQARTGNNRRVMPTLTTANGWVLNNPVFPAHSGSAVMFVWAMPGMWGYRNHNPQTLTGNAEERFIRIRNQLRANPEGIHARVPGSAGNNHSIVIIGYDQAAANRGDWGNALIMNDPAGAAPQERLGRRYTINSITSISWLRPL